MLRDLRLVGDVGGLSNGEMLEGGEAGGLGQRQMSEFGRQHYLIDKL